MVSFAQKDFYTSRFDFNEADTLRGALNKTRTCYDVLHYKLDISVFPESKSLAGYVDMKFRATEDFLTLQMDLFENMQIDKIVFPARDNRELAFKRRFNAFFVNLGEKLEKGSVETIRIYYSGKPVEAKNAPWDGGFVWSQDEKERTWIGVACEGDGASLWWPNKDHLSDEPESMDISIAVPNHLMCIANGRLVGSEDMKDDFKKFHWEVAYPINNYNVSINIAHYAHFSDTYTAQDGEELNLDYYVLDYNLEKAKEHFKQVDIVLESFEHYFGKYPFWKDGFALIETPYLGMEHQSGIAYGNQYMRGYLGGMIPRDMDWDYIIVHETGHEYFGNSISCNDHAEMWLHESFTTYMEALFVEYTMSFKDAVRYLKSQRYFITNKQPIIGPMDVNWTQWSSSDHYYKGAWILHTLRNSINDDEIWWDLLKSFHEDNRIKNLDSGAFFKHVEKKTGRNYDAFFEQYLFYPGLPELQFKVKRKGKKIKLSYRWEADVPGFNMPVTFFVGGEQQKVFPTSEWSTKTISCKKGAEVIFPNDLFLVEVNQNQ